MTPERFIDARGLIHRSNLPAIQKVSLSVAKESVFF